MLNWEYQKQREEEHGWDGKYTEYMKLRLGPKLWEDLLARAEVKLKPKEIREMVYKILNYET